MCMYHMGGPTCISKDHCSLESHCAGGPRQSAKVKGNVNVSLQ